MAYFVGAILALHLLRPDVSPIHEPTSRYAVGPFGALMRSAFVGVSLASWALLVGLAVRLPARARSSAGLVLLGVWSTGVIIAMMFPLDAEGAIPTVSGTVHRVNGPIAFLSLTAAAVLVSLRFKGDDAWRPFHRIAMPLALGMLGAAVANMVNLIAGGEFAGLIQRVFLSCFATWFCLTALRLRHADSHVPPR